MKPIRITNKLRFAFASFFLSFLLVGNMAPAMADQQADLRENAKRVEQLYEEGRLTEQEALEALKHIEALAVAYRKNEAHQPSAEEMATGSLMRQAAFPKLSVFDFLLRYVAPVLVAILTIGFIVFFYGSSVGLNHIANWLGRRGHQAYQSLYGYVSAYRSNAPEAPMAPRAAPRPPENRASPPYPPPGSRHSGEVPDHLA